MHEDFDGEEAEELFGRLTEYQIEVDELNAQLDNVEADSDNWRRIANDRAREIKQLLSDHKEFHQRSKQLIALLSEEYSSLLTVVKALDDDIRAKHTIEQDDQYTCPLMCTLHKLIVKASISPKERED